VLAQPDHIKTPAAFTHSAWLLNARTPSTVPEADQAHFVTLVLAEFKALHAGNAVRFGIGPLELAAWQTSHGWHLPQF